jgi:hypothetical protein
MRELLSLLLRLGEAVNERMGGASVSAILRGIRSTPEALAQPAFTNGLRRSASLAVVGRCIWVGLQYEHSFPRHDFPTRQY